MPSHGLQHREGADDVRVQEGLGVVQRFVDVRLRGEMHHSVSLGDQLRDQLGVSDIALHEPDVFGHRCQRFAAARIGERVQHRDIVLTHHVVHKVCADETGSAGDQQSHGSTVAV